MRSNSKERRYTAARERAEKQSTGFIGAYLDLPKGVQLFKPKTGTMLLDILPYAAGKGNPWAEPGNLHWERTFYVHRGIGANSDSFLCPRMTRKEKCPVCEHRLTLIKEGDEDNEELIKDLSPKQRQLFNVINLKDPDKGVQIWDISYHLFGKILDARLRNSDEEDGWEKFFFLEDGLTLKIGFAEKTFGGATFHEVETIDFKSRKEDYDDEILEQVHNLDKMLIVPDYSDLKKTFLETREEEEDEDEEDEDNHKPKAKKRVKDEDEEDTEEEDEDEKPKAKKKTPKDGDDWDDFDEDEDEKPKAKKKPSKDEEEEADEDEEEDEDEKPAKAKKKSSKEDDWDEDEEDEEKPKAKKKSKDEDEDEEEEDTEEEEKPRKKKSAFAKQKGDKGWDKEEDEDEEDDE
jgi:hypothetical protein